MLMTKTTTALLDGLNDPSNEELWREFDERYRTIVIGFARRLGLRDQDAADVAQETMLRFVKSYRQGGYERERGRLRSWIIGIARHCAADLLAQRGGARGESAIGFIAETDEKLESIWQSECENEILRRGMEQLRTTTRLDPGTIDAFERLVFHDLSASEVARQLGVTTNEVYLAKHRCLTRLRSIVAQLTLVYDL